MRKIFLLIILAVPLEIRASRLVVLMPSHVEIICELKACDEIIAVGSYCDWPPEISKKQKIGDYFRPNLEKIYSIKPDVIFLTRSTNSTAARDLRKLNLKVEELEPEKSLDDICLTAKRIGKIIGRVRESKAFCAKLKKEFSSTKPGRRKKVFFEIDSGFWTLGGESFIDEILKKAGLENIFSSRKESYFKVSWEAILKENPDVIISNHSKPEYFYSLPLSSRLKAVSNKKVFILDKDLTNTLVRPGPRSPYAVRKLMELINE